MNRAVAGLACLLIALVGGAFVPWEDGATSSRANPAADYAEAVRRAAALDAANAAAMNPVCRVQLITHGNATEHVIVLIHGYTSCPQQFHDLGQRFFDQGYNVLIAPLPHHGLADRLTDSLSALTASELASYGDGVIDIAHGLGGVVDVAGISAGGVVTAWAAQNRSDVNLAVVISPAFGFKQIPTPLTAPAINLTSVLPESYSWWDPVLQMDVKPSYAYPRYSRHALAQIVRLGFSVQSSARRARPVARRILVVTNANEPSVNNELTARLVASWRARGADIATYEFPSDLQLPHDLIDPNQPDQKIDAVYPTILELVEQYR